MGGKTKRDHKLIKAMLAKSYTDVRGAYLKTEEHRKRISFFGGTCNDLQILPDHGENRRIIPIQIVPGGIDQKAKDLIDPIDYLLEAWHLYHSGFDYKILKGEIDFLNQHTEQFKESTMEAELAAANFRKPSDDRGQYMNATEIKIVLERGIKDRINVSKIRGAMKEIGVDQTFTKVNGVAGRYYFVEQIGVDYAQKAWTQVKKNEPDDEMPF
jgi:predicted P-loop ATPase